VKVKDKRVLRELDLRRRKPGAKSHCVWDAKQPGLVLRVRPSGRAALAFVYNRSGKTRWYTIGDGVFLSDARRIAARLRLAVVEGRDPAAERKAERDAGTFGELARRYVEEWSKRRNRSWEQADYLVRAHLLPRWSGRIAREITRADVRAAIGAIASPSVANQTRAAASAIFSFGVRMEVLALNPVLGVERHETKSRERMLSDSEIKLFWPHLSPPLRVLLLTGQRPGEVIAMRCEHIVDGWWEMPGEAVPALGWRGTKNKKNHRVWLPHAAREIIGGEGETGRVFVRAELDAEMREICRRLGVREKATPHDLRRTHGSTITRLGFGRDAMNRIQNHIEGGIADVYDRHRYEVENKRVMEAVAEHVVAIAAGRPAAGAEVVRGFFPSKV
jgi:integrase